MIVYVIKLYEDKIPDLLSSFTSLLTFVFDSITDIVALSSKISFSASFNFNLSSSSTFLDRFSENRLESSSVMSPPKFTYFFIASWSPFAK